MLGLRWSARSRVKLTWLGSRWLTQIGGNQEYQASLINQPAPLPFHSSQGMRPGSRCACARRPNYGGPQLQDRLQRLPPACSLACDRRRTLSGILLERHRCPQEHLRIYPPPPPSRPHRTGLDTSYAKDLPSAISLQPAQTNTFWSWEARSSTQLSGLLSPGSLGPYSSGCRSREHCPTTLTVRTRGKNSPSSRFLSPLRHTDCAWRPHV